MQTPKLLAGTFLIAAMTASSHAAHTNNILMTGYWPPTNEMVRPFSTNPDLNPDGWIGEDWEGRGYDVYAFFPEFDPPTCSSCGQGFGDLEVDYQDTSTDFWNIVAEIQPVAIITFSRTGANFSWEVENNHYNYTNWVNDYSAPLQPTPSPPDDSVPGDFLRETTLPADAIVAAIDEADLGLNPFICFASSAGSFLSGFMGYHGVWYQDIHKNPGDPVQCVAAGHMHIGDSIDWDTAHAATLVTLRTLIEHVNTFFPPQDLDGDGTVGPADLALLLGDWGPCGPRKDCPADFDGNSVVNAADLAELLGSWS